MKIAFGSSTAELLAQPQPQDRLAFVTWVSRLQYVTAHILHGANSK